MSAVTPVSAHISSALDCSESLDQLEALVTRLFSAVVDTGAAMPHYAADPLSNSYLMKLFKVCHRCSLCLWLSDV